MKNLGREPKIITQCDGLAVYSIHYATRHFASSRFQALSSIGVWITYLSFRCLNRTVCPFLADRTNGRAIGTVLRLFAVCLWGAEKAAFGVQKL